MNNSPVIIAGCGRSGTTYLRSLIDAHPDIFIPSESLYIVDYLKAENHRLKPFLKWLYWKEPQLNAWFRCRNFKFDTFKEAIVKTHCLEAEAEGKKIWGQKTPRFIRYNKLIDRSFPSAKWILLHRDARGVVASMLESKSHFYSIYFACRRWNLDNNYLLQDRKDTNVLVISYENLLRDPDDTINKIFDFLNVKPYQVSYLIENAKIRKYAGSKFRKLSIQKGFRPDPSKIDDWQNRLSHKQIKSIEYLTSDMMMTLGYSLSNEKQSKPGFFQLVSPKDLLVLFEYIRKWPKYLFVTFVRKGLLALIH